MQQCRLTVENGHLRIQNPCQHEQAIATCRQWTESDIDNICLDLLGSSLESVPIPAAGELKRGKFSRNFKIQSRLESRNGRVVVRGPFEHIPGSSSEVNTKINDPRRSLLTLPAEIRLTIYRHLLVSAHLSVLCPIPDGFRIVNEEPFHPESRLYPQILQTCKMINNEATSMLYSENLFRRNFYWPNLLRFSDDIDFAPTHNSGLSPLVQRFDLAINHESGIAALRGISVVFDGSCVHGGLAAMCNCVSKSCTLEEGIKFQNFVSSICDVPTKDHSQMYRSITIVFATFTFASVILRLGTRIRITKCWGADDTWIVIASLIVIPATVTLLFGIEKGFGALDVIYNGGTETLSLLLKSMFLWQIFYMLGLAAAKTSILFFYLRIFPDQKFRLAVWTTMAFNGLATIVILILNFTVGRAVQGIWGGADDVQNSMESYGSNFKINLLHSVVSFVLDIWMLILPMTQLYNLGLKKPQKIRVISMFSMGILLTIVSLVRMVIQITVLPAPSDLDGSAHAIVILGSTELYVCVIVACIPSTRQLFQHVGSWMTGNKKEESTVQSKRSSRPAFVDRSLIRIYDDENSSTMADERWLTNATTLTSGTQTAKGKDIELDVIARSDEGKIV
ncbi:hypothetical protein FHETE_7232 [Fusarium heterosporum]|uniref:Rhodopsin domain-containing protein n=1 Tax=Fusarium heterosporum TaxID=42747 RepID=A0A8H5T6S7_FUSHE|nr:hypothetical protein FHETE_7232 [Fusarium heterosporum]